MNLKTNIEPLIELQDIEVRAHRSLILEDVHLKVSPQTVTCLLGPSGSGKSTLLRVINRMSDLQGLRINGKARFGKIDILASSTDVDALRQSIGMLFQQPVIFPTSIANNVLFGCLGQKQVRNSHRESWIEQMLVKANLWNEVKDRLNAPAMCLSVGQQQRLCLARALAVQPEVLLMDEPTSALDIKSTEQIEDLIKELRSTMTLIVVTHNERQATSIAQQIVCLERRNEVGRVAAFK